MGTPAPSAAVGGTPPPKGEGKQKKVRGNRGRWVREGDNVVESASPRSSYRRVATVVARKEDRMKYALLIYADEKPQVESTPEEQQEVMDAYWAFTNEITERGIMLGGEALNFTETATTVRVRDGETMTTDGPFAETKEALGGFYLIDVADLDEAIAVAAKLPGSWHGSVEVRPVVEFDAPDAG
jgi:hypothetical protein